METLNSLKIRCNKFLNNNLTFPNSLIFITIKIRLSHSNFNTLQTKTRINRICTHHSRSNTLHSRFSTILLNLISKYQDNSPHLVSICKLFRIQTSKLHIKFIKKFVQKSLTKKEVRSYSSCSG